MASSSWEELDNYEREKWHRDLRDIDCWYDKKLPNLQSFLNVKIAFFIGYPCLFFVITTL
jgi:hypothetical protein